VWPPRSRGERQGARRALMALSRRAFLGGLGGAVVTAAASTTARRSHGSSGPVFAVGAIANLTPAPPPPGARSRRRPRVLAENGPLRIETRVFRAGPRVSEALIGGAIDAGTAGPAPIVIHHARHSQDGRGGLRILAGCCSGGASLVVTSASGIARAADL